MVHFISLMANLPRGGYYLKFSTHIALVGTIWIIPQSFFLKNSGFSSLTFPDLLSIFFKSLLNLEAIWAVWQSKTGVYPSLICPGCLITMIWASKDSQTFAGSFLLSEATNPLLTYCTEIPLTLKPTLLPGEADSKFSWCCSMDLTSVTTPPGQNLTDIPGFKTPVSTLPTGTVPTPEIL